MKNKTHLKEGIDDVLHDMGYFFEDEGKNKGKWVHEKTGKALSDKHAQDIAAERAARKPKKPKKETTAAGPNPTDKDARSQDEESTRSESFDLFPKSDERLLREHIRAEYEARGIYPTAREVQETYNHVVSILNERNQTNKEASRVAEIKSGRKVLGRNWASEEDAISAARNTKAGLVNPPMPRGGTRSSVANDATGIRRSNHIAKRGIRNISPSSPAREQSEAEKNTRFLMGQGFSPDHLRRIMSDSGR